MRVTGLWVTQLVGPGAGTSLFQHYQLELSFEVHVPERAELETASPTAVKFSSHLNYSARRLEAGREGIEGGRASCNLNAIYYSAR